MTVHQDRSVINIEITDLRRFSLLENSIRVYDKDEKVAEYKFQTEGIARSKFKRISDAIEFGAKSISIYWVEDDPLDVQKEFGIQ